ncbi:MAG: hypothetical protein AAFX52_11095 [Pseudomonadota bacterium]
MTIDSLLSSKGVVNREDRLAREALIRTEQKLSGELSQVNTDLGQQISAAESGAVSSAQVYTDEEVAKVNTVLTGQINQQETLSRQYTDDAVAGANTIALQTAQDVSAVTFTQATAYTDAEIASLAATVPAPATQVTSGGALLTSLTLESLVPAPATQLTSDGALLASLTIESLAQLIADINGTNNGNASGDFSDDFSSDFG